MNIVNIWSKYLSFQYCTPHHIIRIRSINKRLLFGKLNYYIYSHNFFRVLILYLVLKRYIFNFVWIIFNLKGAYLPKHEILSLNILERKI